MRSFLRRVIQWFLDDRLIFRYWDGRRYRRADPWSIYRQTMNSSPFSWDTTPGQIAMEAIDEVTLRDKLDATKIAVDMVRRVFGVRPMEEGGLTESECLLLLWQFSRYVGDVKKNGKERQTSPASTELPRQTVTSPDLASGSTGTERGPEMHSGPPEVSSGP